MLAGKRLLITGVLTKGSIAYSVAERAQQEGAEIVLTGFGRTRRMTERAAARLPDPPDVLELDVNNPDDFAALRSELESRWGGIDGALHAIAFAPGDALGGNFMSAPPESAELAFRTSAYSFKALARRCCRCHRRASWRSTSTRAWPGRCTTGWALPRRRWSRCRAIWREIWAVRHAGEPRLGGAGRHAGRRGDPGFDQLAGLWEQQAPMGWDVKDPSPVADAVLFLLSDCRAACPARSCTWTAASTPWALRSAS